MRLQELAIHTITGFHYSFNTIAHGETIKSEQHEWPNFAIVWPIYKKVADELGLYFPAEYGYAYPKKREHMGDRKVYAVSAPTSKVTKGNLDHSANVCAARLRDFMDKSIKDLTARKKKRDERIEEEARAYFTELSDPSTIELISDEWKVL